MSWPRFLWIPLFACLGAFLLSSLGFHPLPGAPAAVPPPEDAATADPAAACALEQAASMLNPARVHWLEMTSWQRVSIEGLAYEATGHFLSGPGQQVRVDLQTQVGDTEGHLRLVGDGSLFWKATRIGSDSWTSVARMDLPEVLVALKKDVHPYCARDQFAQCSSCGGVFGVLESLRTRVRWTRQERVCRNGCDMMELTGAWNPEAVRQINAAEGAWPADLPRRCRLYLDARTLWPHRIEWWGPAAAHKQDALLVEMEFRDPKINRPPSVERCISAFGFDPGNVPVVDQTQEIVNRMR